MMNQNDKLERVTVEISAPCDTCVHEPVCAIRRQLDSLTSILVPIPVLDQALAIELAATVECGHYLAVKGSRRAGTGQKLNLTDEERERRREQGRANLAARKAS